MERYQHPGNLQINGTKKESAEESMMYLFHAIDDAYFTGTDYVACEGDYVLEETNINISTPVAASRRDESGGKY